MIVLSYPLDAIRHVVKWNGEDVAPLSVEELWGNGHHDFPFVLTSTFSVRLYQSHSSRQMPTTSHRALAMTDKYTDSESATHHHFC